MPAKATQKTPVSDNVTVEALKKGAERSVEMGKDNMDALKRSVTATAKGVEALGSESRAFAKQAMDDGIKAGKAMMSAKTAQEFMTLQADYSRSAFDQMINQMTKVNDMAMCMAKEAYAPLNERVTTVTELVQKSRSV